MASVLRSRRASVVALAVASVVAPVAVVGCSDSSSPGAGADVGGGGTVPDTGPTDDLAPSQMTAATVPRPPTPPPCDPAVIEIGPSGVDAGDPTLVSIRVENVGTEWCEVDVSGSPSADARMEPDVWFEVGGTAELLVQLDVESCADPVLVDEVEVDINAAVRSVAVGADVFACTWSIVAFYPVEAVDTED